MSPTLNVVWHLPYFLRRILNSYPCTLFDVFGYELVYLHPKE